MKVSVPSRGLIYLNELKRDDEFIRIVSVPSRGLIYLNVQHVKQKGGENRFPSPLGDLYISIRKPSFYQYLCPGFRPLSGTYISQYAGKSLQPKRQKGFRPLSGTYISQYNDKI